MNRIVVTTQSITYPVVIGTRFLNNISSALSLLSLPKPAVVVMDENVHRLWGNELLAALSEYSLKLGLIRIPPGEKTKSLYRVKHILDYLHAGAFGRDTLLIAVGGGVTGDLAGFAASIYNRGIQLVHIPTTLLAMIDSSIGGKTGINFRQKKNSVGTFYQPSAVLTDTQFLSTLPRKEFLSGCGEMAKYAFLATKDTSAEIATFLRDPSEKDVSLITLISECVGLKAGIVEADEHESGLRKALNLGHTFGHAIETATSFRVPHGIAVAAGLACAVRLSRAMGLIDAKKEKAYIEIPNAILNHSPVKLPRADMLMRLMRYDKKSKGSVPMFVLIRGIGELALDVPCPEALVRKACGMP